MRIIIAGGTGLIGRPLSQALIADGHEVIVLTRDPAKVKDIPSTVKAQPWDGKTAQGWGQSADGAGAIINLAGAGIADGRWSQARKQAIRQSRIDAGKAIVEAIAAATNKPQVVIRSSAVGYYGTETGDALVTETTSPGSDFLSKVCFDWEVSTAAVSRMGIRRPIVRTGIVLSNDGGAFPKLVMPFKFFIGGPLGAANNGCPGFISTTRCAPFSSWLPTTRPMARSTWQLPHRSPTPRWESLSAKHLGAPLPFQHRVLPCKRFLARWLHCCWMGNVPCQPSYKRSALPSNSKRRRLRSAICWQPRLRRLPRPRLTK